MVKQAWQLILACVLAAHCWAEQPTEQPTGQPTGQPAEPVADPQNVAEVLTELDEAGLPPTEAEIAEFLAASTSSATGYWLARLGWLSGAGPTKTSRLRWASNGFSIRAKWRQDLAGRQEYGLAAQYGIGGLRLAAGQLGLAQGFGLLVGGAGRGPSLTADGALSAGGRGLLSWGGAAEKQTILGASVGWAGAHWQMTVLAGHRATDILTSQELPATTVVWQTMVIGDRWQVTLASVLDPLETGFSVAGRWRRGLADGAWEAVWRLPADSAQPLGAWLGQLGWRPNSNLYFECLMGWADSGPRPLMGTKHPVLGGWSGQGVAVRGTWRPASGLGLKVLIHGGRTGALAVDRREKPSLVDLQLSRRWPGGWRLDGRWRSGTKTVEEFSARFPWQPATLAWRDTRDVVSLKGTWQRERSRVSLAWRQLALARIRQDTGWESGGVRSMVAFGSVLGVAARGKLRLGWNWSWGDPVDLVSAVVPFGGYVLPRHWGHWRSEVIVGLEWPWRALEAKMALSKRDLEVEIPALGSNGGQSWAGWWEMVWHW